MGFLNALKFSRLKEGLAKTRDLLVNHVAQAFGGNGIDDDVLRKLEESLLLADVGTHTTRQIMDALCLHIRKQKIETPEDALRALRNEVEALLAKFALPDASGLEIKEKPHVVMIVGVNGAGKTTTIGKLAHLYKENKLTPIVAAGDTFRAAAGEQLNTWAERAGIEIVMQHHGADPASVAFDAVKSAQAHGKDVVLIDTAGRLHTKTNLMEELKKIPRVIKKLSPNAPHEVLLVLDATNGQNAIEQARHFTAAVHVTGLVLTKLDGTAKGGVVLAIANELSIPVKFVGVGETIDDLQPFDPSAFAEAMFSL